MTPSRQTVSILPSIAYIWQNLFFSLDCARYILYLAKRCVFAKIMPDITYNWRNL